MDVIEIPTNRLIRKDKQDAVYKTKRKKNERGCGCHYGVPQKGQPVLVGTITIETSEEVSRMLQKKGFSIKC